MNICQCLVDVFQIFPEDIAIVFEDRHYTFGEIEDLSARAASLLADSGVRRGDRVALCLGNVPAFPVWYYGCLRLGAIAVSVNTRLVPEEVDFVLSDCGASILVTPEHAGETRMASSYSGKTLCVTEDGTGADGAALSDHGREGRGSFVDLHPDDPGVILYTSGTTGFPKGATLSHANVRATVHAFNHLCGMRRGDRLLVNVPLFHCYGQNALLNAGLNTGATVVLQRRFDLVETRELIRRHRITKLFGVPATFQFMLDSFSPDELASVDYCFCAAATLAPQVGQRWHEKFGMPIFEGYGLTETAPFASYNHPLHHVPGSIGVPVDLAEMKIVDPETGETCPPGVAGEIAVRGPNVMLGYWNRPEETAGAVRDGWFYSGDVGKRDEKGYYYIVDRIKDMIAVGGLKVFPSEVERILFDDPVVSDCAVVGWPHKTWGEEVVAFIVTAGGVAQAGDTIRARCIEHLAAYKVPSRVIFVDSLPRNPAGKVLKTLLRDRFKNESADAVGGLGAARETGVSPLLIKLRETHPSGRRRMLTEYLQEEIRVLTGAGQRPGVETALFDTGMDSVMMINLGNSLQEQIGPQLELPATLVFDYPRICDLAAYLHDAVGSESAVMPAMVESSPDPGLDEKSEAGPPIEEMSEKEAMEALMRELQD